MINASYNEQEVGMTGTGYNTTWRTVFIILSCKLTLVKNGAKIGTGGLTGICLTADMAHALEELFLRLTPLS